MRAEQRQAARAEVMGRLIAAHRLATAAMVAYGQGADAVAALLRAEDARRELEAFARAAAALIERERLEGPVG